MAKKPKKPGPKPTTPPTALPGYERLVELGPERLGAIETQLMKGIAPQVIARMMQTEWNLYPDVKEGTLAKQLMRYRDKHIIPNFQNMQQKVAAGVFGSDKSTATAMRSMTDKFNVMDHLEEIAIIQRKRIMKSYAREEKMPVVTDGLTKLFKDYVGTLDKLAHLQMETGVLKRAPKVIQGQLGLLGEGKTPLFEVLFETTQYSLEGFGELTQLAHDAIEGEYARLESDDPDSDAGPAGGAPGQ